MGMKEKNVGEIPRGILHTTLFIFCLFIYRELLTFTPYFIVGIVGIPSRKV